MDRDEAVLEGLSACIRQLGHEVTPCRTPREALDALQARLHAVMICELAFTSMDGFELMDRARTANPELAIVVLTAHGSIEGAVRAVRAGALDYLQKPADPAGLRRVLRAIRPPVPVSLLSPLVDPALPAPGQLVGRSHPMRRLFELTDLAAPSSASVLIRGEPGTGKESLARLLHAQSPRADGPFVLTDARALGAELLAEEIFGNAAGPASPGKLEKANGGTFLLKEAGRLPPELQIRLSTFLSDRTLRNESGRPVTRPDVRVMASSARDLGESVARGRFREDLFFRLSVVHLEVPPLRDRKIDILPLARAFLARATAMHDLDIRGFHRHTLALLMEYNWPGNVTELKEAVEQAALACTETLISFQHLPVSIRKHFTGTALDWNRSLKEVEREHILKVLEGVNWNRTRAAEVLGIRRMTLYNKIREFNLTPLRKVDREGLT